MYIGVYVKFSMETEKFGSLMFVLRDHLVSV